MQMSKGQLVGTVSAVFVSRMGSGKLLATKLRQL